MASDDSATSVLHGTAVAVGSSGLFIRGASGSGKSSLAIEMMALGADLVADDQVECVVRDAGDVLMRPPEKIQGMIEGRGVGLIRAPWVPARLCAVVDMDRVEVERLPEWHDVVISGARVPCLGKVETPVFAAMLVAYLNGGRAAP